MVLKLVALIVHWIWIALVDNGTMLLPLCVDRAAKLASLMDPDTCVKLISLSFQLL